MGFTHYELSPEPETFLSETGTITFGNTILEIIFAPGHSPAHLCFYSKADHILIGGDVLFYGSVGRSDLPGGNHQQLIDNIREKLFVLPNETTVIRVTALQQPLASKRNIILSFNVMY
jgi:hydroxyacylglutathione hydrolase